MLVAVGSPFSWPKAKLLAAGTLASKQGALTVSLLPLPLAIPDEPWQERLVFLRGLRSAELLQSMVPEVLLVVAVLVGAVPDAFLD